ncbi:uncharacterized protein LOC134825097 [Bolinopsis microptera]|uniref:uncharacterized protein LOC134825097 n=1 Tax=Bolinopsis microptera TaxID=2820187 RepID=UPI00307AB19C
MTPWKRERSSSDGDNSEDHSSESDSDETEPQEQRDSISDQEERGHKESSVTSEEAWRGIFKEEEASDSVDNMNDSSDEELSDVPESITDLVMKRPSNKSNANSPENNLKYLKCDLKGLMKLPHDSTNSGDFATSGLLSDAELPNIPLIEVNGYGLLSFPLNDTTFQCLKPLYKQTSCGKGEETLAVKGRNSYQLEPTQFEIKNETFTNQINLLIQNKIKSGLGLAGATIYGKICKLIIYEKGSKSEEHKDMENEYNMFGTLIVQLPSVFTGGNFVVKHLQSSRAIENSCVGSSTHCKFVAHYSNCPHELDEVTSGYRAVLIYSLCWDGTGAKPSPYVASTNTVKLCNSLNLLMDSSEVSYLCWGLENKYSDAIIQRNSLKFFKGKDKNAVRRLKSAFDYDLQVSVQGKDNWEFFIATANKTIEEYRDCTGGYGWSGGCPGNCELVEENDRSLFIDNFIPLSTNSSKYSDLKLAIDPPTDILNFPNRKVLAGKVKRRKENESDEEFWGTEDLGGGCSGPDEDEGGTKNLLYQKQVLVLWRTDCSLAIRCESSLLDGVSYVLSLLEKGHTEEGEKGFKYLWGFLDSFVDRIGYKQELIIKMLRMCHILKLKENSETLLEVFKERGICSNSAGKIIADTLELFADDSHKNIIRDIIRSTEERQIPTLLHFCKQLSWIDPSELFELLVNYVLKEEYSDTPHTTDVLRYMFDENLVLDSLLDTLVNKIVYLSHLEFAISLSIKKQDVKVLNVLLNRFVEIAVEDFKDNAIDYSLSLVFESIVRGVKRFQQLSASVSTLVTKIKSLPKYQQDFIKSFTKMIMKHNNENKENLPECLQKACLIRIEYLEETVSKVEPEMNWHQPNAILSEYSDVEAFLRGPNQQMLFGRGTFRTITAAKSWVNSYEKSKGCFMTLTASGIGQKAEVKIVKTVEGFYKQVAEYTACVEEYEGLLKFVPNHQSVIPKKLGEQNPGNSNNSTDGTKVVLPENQAAQLKLKSNLPSSSTEQT